jgi:hypothetical protein
VSFAAAADAYVGGDTALELDRDAGDQSHVAGARDRHLAQLFRVAGLREVEEAFVPSTSCIQASRSGGEPFPLGVGPAGGYAAGLEAKRQARPRELSRELLRQHRPC